MADEAKKPAKKPELNEDGFAPGAEVSFEEMRLAESKRKAKKD